MKNQNVELKDGWSTDAEYKRLYQASDEVLEVMESLELEGASALLDNGCGNGEFSVQAVCRFPGLKVFGYDALESAIVEARKKTLDLGLAGLDFDVAWANDLPLADGSVDRALFRSVLHHIAEPREVFAELARCLSPGGLLMLKAPYNHWGASFSNFLSELHLLMDDSHRRYYYTEETIRRELEESGFSIREFMPSAYEFPTVNEQMKNFIVQKGFSDQLKLKQIAEDRWTVTLYWVRIMAVRNSK